MEKEFDLSMCRIIVDNAEQSKKIQELAFKQGFYWWGSRKIVINTHVSVLYFNSITGRITFSELEVEDSEFKTFHFTDIFKETLQEKEQRLLKELEEVRKEMEENKPKVGDWCKFWDDDKSILIVGKLERVAKTSTYPYRVCDDERFKNCEKITDSTLLESLKGLDTRDIDEKPFEQQHGSY